MPLLHLLRHAEAAPGSPDVDRPLTPRGREQASALRDALGDVELALVSPARRTRETAELAGLDGRTRVVDGLHAATETALLDEIIATDDAITELALVAHNPAIAALARMITDHDRRLGSFPPATLVSVELDAWTRWSPPRAVRVLNDLLRTARFRGPKPPERPWGPEIMQF